MPKQLTASAVSILALTALATSVAADGMDRAGSMKDVFSPPAYSPPAFSWTGFYLGSHVGYRWGDVDTGGHNLAVPLDFALQADSVVGGLQAGYNYQLPGTALVIGLEADVSFGGGGDSRLLAAAETRVRVNADTSGSVRARLGWAWDRTLLFATAGVAWQDTSARVVDRDLGVLDINVANSRTTTGWVVGGGVEYALSNHWTMRAEYLHADFGGTSFNLIDLAGNNDGRLRYSTTTDTIRAAVNYKF